MDAERIEAVRASNTSERMTSASTGLAFSERRIACNSSLALEAACLLFRPYLADSPIERLVIAGFDARIRLAAFGESVGEQGSVCGLLPLSRRIMGHGDVSILVIGHNHPSGIATPSQADREATRRIAALCRLAGMRLAGHLLFGGDDYVLFGVS